MAVGTTPVEFASTAQERERHKLYKPYKVYGASLYQITNSLYNNKTLELALKEIPTH